MEDQCEVPKMCVEARRNGELAARNFGCPRAEGCKIS